MGLRSNQARAVYLHRANTLKSFDHLRSEQRSRRRLFFETRRAAQPLEARADFQMSAFVRPTLQAICQAQTGQIAHHTNALLASSQWAFAIVLISNAHFCLGAFGDRNALKQKRSGTDMPPHLSTGRSPNRGALNTCYESTARMT